MPLCVCIKRGFGTETYHAPVLAAGSHLTRRWQTARKHAMVINCSVPAKTADFDTAAEWRSCKRV
jgi:hypothetical protein